MRSKAKARPYPVLGRADDFTESQFQSFVETSIRQIAGEDRLVLEYKFLMSSPELLDIIESGKAQYALDIECADTLFRRVVPCEPSGDIVFEAGELYGRIEILPCVLARESISGFSATDINPEFGSSAFSFAPGDLYAIDDLQIRFIEFDRLKLESLVRAAVDDSLPPYEYRIDLKSDCITISMGVSCKRVFDAYRGNRELAPFLAMSLYKDCLHAALDKLCRADSDNDERWARALQERLARDGIRLSADEDYDSIASHAQKLVANIGIQRLAKNVD